MPMPEASTPSQSQESSPEVSQPSLLEERRAWVKKDRDLKLDIFLSLHEDVMLEVFDDPTTPPPSLSAQQMLNVLNNHFAEFKFEAFHHAFCHFLNIHIDQFQTVEDFNLEFSTTLEDLLDYGQPLSNAQACSAYFSKLRCSQNPWVVKKLAEWDSLAVEPELIDLMKESPPWSYIRPLATKTSQNFHTDVIPEESLEDSETHSDSETSERSVASRASSRTTHSRHTSTATRRSQEITVHVSAKDIADVGCPASPKDSETSPSVSIPERQSSRDCVPGTPLADEVSAAPAVKDFKKAITRVPVPAPVDRPLPPLPAPVRQSVENDKRTRSPSPHIINAMNNASQTNLSLPTSNQNTSRSTLQLEMTHPTLRPRTSTPTPVELPAFRTSTPTPAPVELPADRPADRPAELPADRPASRMRTPTPPMTGGKLSADIHPALRSRTPTPTPDSSAEPSPDLVELPTSTSAPIPISLSSPPPIRVPDFGASLPNLAIPWPMSPDTVERPQSSRASLPASKPSEESTPQITEDLVDAVTTEAASDEGTKIKEVPGGLSPFPQLNRSPSTSSSNFNLPLQGTRDSAWEYLHESRNFLCSPNNPPPEPPTPHSEADDEITALPALKETRSRTPTFSDVVIPPDGAKTKTKKASVSLYPATAKETTTRRSAENSSGAIEGAAEKLMQLPGKKMWKKGSWNMHVDLTRFSSHKGVREII